jgi:signal transduction histidine kinase
MDVLLPNSDFKQQRALEMLRRAAQELNPQMDINDILLKTVELSNELMESTGSSTRYFSHIAVKEGARMYFDEKHNLPEVYAMLVKSLGTNPEINLNRPNGKTIGITGAAAIAKSALNIGNVREHAEYIDLKDAGGAQLAVPIMLDGEVFAILNIEHEAENAFSEQDTQTMLALSSIVSSVIDSKENHNALKVLFGGIQALTRTFEYNRKLKLVLDEIAKQAYELMAQKARKPDFAFAHVGIVEGNRLNYVAAHPPMILDRFNQETYSKINLDLYGTKDEKGKPIRIGISGYAVVTGKTQNVPDVEDHPHFLTVNIDEKIGERTINSQLAVPIKLQNDEVVGVISIDHPSFSAFTKEDVENVELLAEIAAEAYRINRQNEQQVRALTVIQQSAREIMDNINLSLDVILRKTVELVKEMFARDFTNPLDYISHIAIREGNTLIFKPEHNYDFVYASFRIAGYDRVIFKDAPAGQRIGVVGRTALTGETQLVPDVNLDPDYFTIRSSGSQLSVPILDGRQIFAVLSVEHRTPNFFDEDDKAAIEALAAQVSAVMTIFNSRLARVRLEERDKQRSRFISNISHELRAPLWRISLFVEGLVNGVYSDFNDPIFQKNLNIIHRRVADQSELIYRLLEETRMEAGKTQPKYELHDVTLLVQDVFDTYSERATRRGIDLFSEVPPLLTLMIRMDRFMIKRVLNNLVDNAIKYTDQGAVTIRVTHNETHCFIEVEDSGMGIAAEDRERIFQHMDRGDSEAIHDREGIGLGLYLVQQYLALHDGTIELKWTEIGKGSAFVVTLPVLGPKSEG